MGEEARQLGLCGCVQNRHGRSVEALVTGPLETVDLIIEWSRHGPPSAVVYAVDVIAGGGHFSSRDPWPMK
jgi:acylphosphatase